jgi:hypothetical protein
MRKMYNTQVANACQCGFVRFQCKVSATTTIGKPAQPSVAVPLKFIRVYLPGGVWVLSITFS